MTNAIIYARVSTDAQKQDLQRQLQACRQKAATMGAVVVGEIDEVSPSERAVGVLRVIEMARNSEARQEDFAMLIFDGESRISRDWDSGKKMALDLAHLNVKMVNVQSDDPPFMKNPLQR